MHKVDTPLAEMLLAGPRGRRMLLEYALMSEADKVPGQSLGSFATALWEESYNFDPDESTHICFCISTEEKPQKENLKAAKHAPAKLAKLLDRVQLLEPTPQLLLYAVAEAVDNAMYWQEPWGEDVLAATFEVRKALERVAEHVAASPAAQWWLTPVDNQGQSVVHWDEDHPIMPIGEKRIVCEPDHWRGGWWSSPSWLVPASTRCLLDGTPAGLWFVEDRLGWDSAKSVNLVVPEGVRVFEIACGSDWAQLCARFPRYVGLSTGEHWSEITKRKARWLMPDWVQVAQQYDAVHLQVGAYLAAAGTLIPVDDGVDAAGMIAGWNPDASYWFTPNITYGQEYRSWQLVENGTQTVWMPAA